MAILSAALAVLALFLTAALVMIPGGVLFALVGFPLFLFALAGVLTGVGDRDVRQRHPSMDGWRWRNGGG
jgi:uncharacterized membrane protein